ncbi:MAG: glycosyltransferase [Acidobacteriota bacterium]
MSAIIITPDSYDTVRRLVAHLRSQTARHELELVLVLPSGAAFEPDEHLLEEFAAVQVVRTVAIDSTARARAAGIRAATSPVVVLTEDHSLPEPDWAQALIGAHRKDWAVAGPAVINGNPRSLLSWANLLIEYGEWLDPAPGGETSHVPGHNSAYKRDVLLSYGESLDSWLEAESLLHWDLRARGYRLCIERSARTRHLNFSKFFASLALRFDAGHLFAGMRGTRWGVWRRLFYAAGSPLIPLVRLFRMLAELRQPGRPAYLIPRILPCVLILLGVDALGEMVGYLLGPGDSARHVTRIDFHRERFMNRRDREQSAGVEP